MKVLLVSTNRCDLMVRPFPLGLAFVAADLEANGHEIDVWDAVFEEDWAASLRGRIQSFQPGAIGLSIRNVDDQEFRAPRFLMGEAREMVDVCREESGATLVAGGAGFSMFPTEAFDYLGVDYGIAGEGERAFPQLLAALAAGVPPTGIPGLVWRDGDRALQAPAELAPDLDRLRRPERARLDAARYYEARGTAPIPNSMTVQSKRGCSLSCIYCATPAVEGTGLRLRSPSLVADEIEALVEMGWRRVQFVDSVFTNPPQHAEAICRELIRRRVDVAWSCMLNPAFAPPSLLRLMREAGCQLVMVGNESGCGRQLDVMRKGFTKADVERCFAAVEAEGLRYNAFLLLGGPGEDRASLDESVEFMQRWRPAQVSVSVGIRLYPGCEVTRIAEAEGLLPRGAPLLTPRFYLAPAVRDWVFSYLEPIMAENPHWVF